MSATATRAANTVSFPKSPEKVRAKKTPVVEFRSPVKQQHTSPSVSQTNPSPDIARKLHFDGTRFVAEQTGATKALVEEKTPKSKRKAKGQSSVPTRRILIRSSSKKCWEATSPLVGYQRWRAMQYAMNWRMIVLLRDVARMSLLRMTDPSVKLKGTDVVTIANQDPNPDADVKFMADGSYRVAPASILHGYKSTGPNKEQMHTQKTEHQSKDSRPWCLLIGCPGHITAGILHPLKGKRQPKIEHFDSRGINKSMTAGGGSYLSLPFIRKYFKEVHGIQKLQTVNEVDFQEVELDVYCQTWIFYFLYMRLIHKHSAKTVSTRIDELDATSKLDEIKRFQQWLLEILEIQGFAPGQGDPASLAECRQYSVAKSDIKSFKLPQKLAPACLKRLALSPSSKSNIPAAAKSSNGGRSVRKSTKSQRKNGIWRKTTKGIWVHSTGSRSQVEYIEIKAPTSDTWKAELAELLLRPAVCLCIKFDGASTADPWHLAQVVKGAKGTGQLRQYLVLSLKQARGSDECSEGSARNADPFVCTFALGRKRLEINLGAQQFGYAHHCVVLEKKSAS